MAQTTSSLSTDAQDEIVEALNQSVAETAITTMVAQNFHWNVTGMAFGPHHALFQEIYEDHFEAQDDIAERIKAIGGHAEGMLSAMVKRSKIAEHDGHASDVDMIKAMLAAQETLASTLAGCGEIAATRGDTLTEDLCIDRGRTHEKFAWMLKAHLS